MKIHENNIQICQVSDFVDKMSIPLLLRFKVCEP